MAARLTMKRCPVCQRDYDQHAEVCAVDGAILGEAVLEVDPLVGETISRRFRVIQKLGGGSFGEVYLSEDLATGNKVAVKVLHSQFRHYRQVAKQVWWDARLAAASAPSRVVRVYQVDRTEAGRVFIVMEFLQGKSLAEVIRRDGALELVRALRLAIQIAEGLAVVAKVGVSHGRLKPENVMLVGSDEQVKLTDFGLGRFRKMVVGDGLTVSAGEYVAPEQVNGDDVDDQTDVYGLGAVLYAMLTGAVSAATRGPDTAQASAVGDMPTPLRWLRPEIPAPLEEFVMRAMEREPARRHSGVHDFLDGLRRLQATTSLTAPEPARAPQSRRRDWKVAATGFVSQRLRPEGWRLDRWKPVVTGFMNRARGEDGWRSRLGEWKIAAAEFANRQRRPGPWTSRPRTWRVSLQGLPGRWLDPLSAKLRSMPAVPTARLLTGAAALVVLGLTIWIVREWPAGSAQGPVPGERSAALDAQQRRQQADAAAQRAEDERRRQAEVAAAQRAEDERRQAEVAAAQRAEDERRQAEAAAAQRAEDERRQAEAAAAQRAEDERRRQAEAAAAAQRAEEERRRQTQVAAAQRAEDERRRQAEAAAAARRAEEERRRQTQVAAAQRAEDERRRQAEAAAAAQRAEEERRRRTQAAAAQRAEDERRRQAEAAAAAQRAEEERRRQTQVAAAQRAEDERRRKAEAAAAQRADEERRRQTQVVAAQPAEDERRRQAQVVPAQRADEEQRRQTAADATRRQAVAETASTPQTSRPAEVALATPQKSTLSAEDLSRIRTQAEQRLLSRGLLRVSSDDRWGVGVDVGSGGVVTLTGALRDMGLQGEAVRLVREVPGVQDVKADVRVADAASVTIVRNDSARLRTEVEQALRKRGLLRESSADRWGVTVEVGAAGEVKLMGVVRDSGLQGEAIRLVEAVPGVRNVKQDIRVGDRTSGQ